MRTLDPAAAPTGALSLVAPAPSVASAEWTPAGRVAFRFLLAYAVLYFFPLPSALAGPGLFDAIWEGVVPWVAARFLHIQITVFSNGSGDTTYDYVRVLCFLVLALVTAIVWSLLDRRRTDYRALLGWARVWLRYALGIPMLVYGMSKVFKLQFQDPGYIALSETYGASSPMRLLWTFMGYSTGYTFAAGAGELLGAFLLFFRRTTTLGALVVIGVMSNVVLLNFCYDVPVKLGSSHLLALAVFLVAPDARRLADLLVWNRPTAPVDLGPQPKHRWVRVSGIVLKVVIVGGLPCAGIAGLLATRDQWGPPVPPSGWYAVSSLHDDGAEVPADAAHRWKTFALFPGYVSIWDVDGTRRAFKAEGEPAKGPLTLRAKDDLGGIVKGAPPAGELRITFAADGRAELAGTVGGHRIEATMVRKETSTFPLMSRGFHWINERPFNE